MTTQSRHADLTLVSENFYDKNGEHVLMVKIINSKARYNYLARAGRFSTESSTSSSPYHAVETLENNKEVVLTAVRNRGQLREGPRLSARARRPRVEGRGPDSSPPRPKQLR